VSTSPPSATDAAEEHPFPLKDLLGFDIRQDEGTGVCRLVVTDQHLNPHGVLHGAVPYAMVDTAMGAATMSILDEGLMCATIEIHTRYLAPCFGGTITATATVRKPGRRVVHLDASVVDGDGTEIVAASGSFAVLPRPDGL
jgi:acyl-CoA thioesterase